TAHRPCVFEVFARRLPSGRRYGVVGGTGRLLERLADFRFSEEEIAVVADSLDERTVEWLRHFRFTGDIDGYREGELYFPGFSLSGSEVAVVASSLDVRTVVWLRNFRFPGDIDGYRAGELCFPGSLVLSVLGGFAECVVLETLVLSVFNHDSAIAAAAARMT